MVETLLLISVNEGLLSVSEDVQHKAISEVLQRSSDGNDRVCAVAVARQEAVQNRDWISALEAHGFAHEVTIGEDSATKLSICLRPGCSVSFVDRFTTGSPNIEAKDVHFKGGALAVISSPAGIVSCIGGFHLDGNMPEKREAQLSSAALRARARAKAAGRRPPDVCLFMGDMNFTLEPLKEADGQDAGGAQLSEALDKMRQSSVENETAQLTPEVLEALQTQLCKPESREELRQCGDRSPLEVEVIKDDLKYDVLWDDTKEVVDENEHAGVSRLQLQPVQLGSMPTFRFCAAAHKAGSAFRQMASPSDSGVIAMQPDLVLSKEAVKELLFADKKSGVMKKRGAMVRLNLGWLDKLYIGTAASESSGKPTLTYDVKQTVPLFLSTSADSEGACLDHALMAWFVALTPSRG